MMVLQVKVPQQKAAVLISVRMTPNSLLYAFLWCPQLRQLALLHVTYPTVVFVIPLETSTIDTLRRECCFDRIRFY